MFGTKKKELPDITPEMKPNRYKVVRKEKEFTLHANRVTILTDSATHIFHMRSSIRPTQFMN